MASTRVKLLVLLLLCPSILFAQVRPGDAGEERGVLRVYAQDPNSTFDIPVVTGAFMTRTVKVPVFFSTSRCVTQIENWIYWNADSLTLESVTKGSGIPAGATFNVTDMGDSIAYNIHVDLADSFCLLPDDTIAVMEFTVPCIGYGAQAHVRFTADDNENYYIASGTSYAPLRDSGKVVTALESYWSVFAGGEHAYVNTGEASIPIGLYFQQAVPGRLTEIRLLWDPDKLDMLSITADTAYIDTFSWSMSGDTMVIDIPESNPVLPVDTTIWPFELLFDLVYCDHDVTDDIAMLYAGRADECGTIKSILVAPGVVHTRDFSVEVDIGDGNAYNTAEYYQVPFSMDATQPVNKYQFYVDFPADSLEYDCVVSYGSFIPPAVDTTGGGGILSITQGMYTNYEPSSLPSRVFYIKFKRRYVPYVGQVFNLTFHDDPVYDNYVQYHSDYCEDYDAGTLDLLDGSITIIQYSGGGGGCPTLYVWSDGAFVRENTILAACAAGSVEENVTDYYMLGNRVETTEEGIRFQIREDGQEISEFKDFRLMVVDHSSNEPVTVTPEGEVITLGSLYGVVWAKDHNGDDITDLVAIKDNVRYVSEESGWVDVSYGKLRPRDIPNFIAALSSSQPKEPPIGVKAGREDSQAESDMKLNVYVRTRTDDWSLIATKDPRSVTVDQATVIDPDLIDPERELVLRYEWKEYYEIDAVEFREAKPFEGETYSASLLSASHVGSGGCKTESPALTSSAIVLRPGEVIELAFDASVLKPINETVTRDYIFVSTGRYETVGEGEEHPPFNDVLGANYPNPFNPGTNIKYSISTGGYVDLRIYDVKGALVRTLVSEYQQAGERTVYWDGKSNNGTQAVSGVYFYRLSTSAIDETKKMILLR